MTKTLVIELVSPSIAWPILTSSPPLFIIIFLLPSSQKIFHTPSLSQSLHPPHFLYISPPNFPPHLILPLVTLSVSPSFSPAFDHPTCPRQP